REKEHFEEHFWRSNTFSGVRKERPCQKSEFEKVCEKHQGDRVRKESLIDIHKDMF
ncbi:hypothetical protein RUM43_014638, partial [Polyplax serrata]